jgi:GH35 family endo-1,4-beta-xylanase
MNSEIKNNRMTAATLTVLKPDKTPLANQDVIIEQIRHKFLFGTAAFDRPLTKASTGETKEQAERRAAKLTALFNAATLPFYWARFEPQRGQPMTEQLKNAAKWCIERGLQVKGHPLCWHTLTADWLLSTNVKSCRKRTAHQRDVSI